jgi:hypothetical protein
MHPLKMNAVQHQTAILNLRCITIRLSDAGERQRPTKLIYPNHRPSPWLTEAAAPRSLQPIVRHPN